jgi:hypothetical protein
MTTLNYNDIRVLADERSLDPERLWIALNQLNREIIPPEDKAALSSGNGWTADNGKIRWLDRENSNRFHYEDFLSRQQS